MIGLDTSVLVAFEIEEHEKHARVRAFAAERRSEGFAIAAQVLSEFCHIVTDPKRFARPMTMPRALDAARAWWGSREVTVVDAGEPAGARFLTFMADHHLGRERLLDTMLAATYLAAGVHVIATLDARDFALFGGCAPIVL